MEVFEGNTADPKTLCPQIQKVRRRFGVPRVVLVGKALHRFKMGKYFEVEDGPNLFPSNNGHGQPQQGCHHVTIELKAGSLPVISAPPVASQESPESSKPQSAATDNNLEHIPSSGPETEQVAQTLSQVSGPPGFDSAAHATVFREALSNLNHTQLLQFIDALDQPGRSGLEMEVRQARDKVKNILVRGPLQFAAKGKQLLNELLVTYMMSSILGLVEQR